MCVTAAQLQVAPLHAGDADILKENLPRRFDFMKYMPFEAILLLSNATADLTYVH